MNIRKALFLPLIYFLSNAAAGAEADAQTSAAVTPILTRALPDVPGKEVTILTVEYPPGGASPAHRHQANTFVYVLEGAVVMKVDSGKEVTLNAGETFYESPTDIHSVSRNASATRPAKFLVFFVKERGAPASMPVR